MTLWATVGEHLEEMVHSNWESWGIYFSMNIEDLLFLPEKKYLLAWL